MNVQSLCLVSSMPRYPQALQELPMVCFLGLTCWKKRNSNQTLKKKTTTHLSITNVCVNIHSIHFWTPVYEDSLTLCSSKPYKACRLSYWQLKTSLNPRYKGCEIFTRSVSGLSHSGHSTNFLMNPSSMSCNLFASWDPLTM